MASNCGQKANERRFARTKILRSSCGAAVALTLSSPSAAEVRAHRSHSSSTFKLLLCILGHFRDCILVLVADRLTVHSRLCFSSKDAA